MPGQRVPCCVHACVLISLLQHLAGKDKTTETPGAAGDARAALDALLRWQFALVGELLVSCDGFSFVS